MELEENIIAINNLINEKIISDNPEIEPITDGIIDLERYLKAKYKILWILKEPYDEIDENDEPYGGGWNISEGLLPKMSFCEFTGGKRTFKPMIYVSWGILNDFCCYNDMSDVEEEPTMLEALKSVAYINVKKLPGLTRSHNPAIESAYEDHKDILHKQIEVIDADIIIGGSTLYNFYSYLGISRGEMQRNESVHFMAKGNKLYVDAYHPAQRTSSTGLSMEHYCDGIILAVKQWYLTQIGELT